MAYYRENKDTRVLVATNFGTGPVEVELEYPVKSVLLSNQKNVLECKPMKMIELNSCEAVVLELSR